MDGNDELQLQIAGSRGVCQSRYPRLGRHFDGVQPIAISDGITVGTEGMKASLVSREVIADSIELVTRGHMFDASWLTRDNAQHVSLPSNLWRKTHTAHQIGETRVSTQWVQPGIDLQFHHPRGALLKCPFQPFQRPIVFPEPGVDQSPRET